MRFKVADAASVKGPIEIVYRYKTLSGEAQHRHMIQPRDIAGNVVKYSVDATNHPLQFGLHSLLTTTPIGD